MYLNIDNPGVLSGTAETPRAALTLRNSQNPARLGPSEETFCSGHSAQQPCRTRDDNSKLCYKICFNFVQTKNSDIRAHNYSSAHTWSQLQFLGGRRQREMFS